MVQAQHRKRFRKYLCKLFVTPLEMASRKVAFYLTFYTEIKVDNQALGEHTL